MNYNILRRKTWSRASYPLPMGSSVAQSPTEEPMWLLASVPSGMMCCSTVSGYIRRSLDVPTHSAVSQADLRFTFVVSREAPRRGVPYLHNVKIPYSERTENHFADGS